MRIRDGRHDEIDAIVALLLASYDEYLPPPDHPRRDVWDAYRDEIADVRGRWAIAEHLVAEDDDGRLVGTATYIPDASLPEMEDDAWPDGYAAMRLLGVHPGARGRGVGRALTDECLRRARAAGRAWFGLHTTQRMAIARDMYERMGFTRFPDNDIPVAPDFVVLAYRLPLQSGG